MKKQQKNVTTIPTNIKFMYVFYVAPVFGIYLKKTPGEDNYFFFYYSNQQPQSRVFSLVSWSTLFLFPHSSILTSPTTPSPICYRSVVFCLSNCGSSHSASIHDALLYTPLFWFPQVLQAQPSLVLPPQEKDTALFVIGLLVLVCGGGSGVLWEVFQ